ncbi:MAG: hypothetical protein ACLFS1_05150 [Opitutales bacterium]
MSEDPIPPSEKKPAPQRLKVFALGVALIILAAGILYWTSRPAAEPEPVAPPQPEAENTEPEAPEPTTESTPEKTPLITFPDPDDAVPYQEARPLEPRDPDAMPWTEFLERPSMWPKRLNITIDQEIPVRYQGNNYGEMIFSPGQQIEVFELSSDGRVLGSINENTVYIPVTATDLENWFIEKHAETEDYDILQIPEAPQPVETATNLSKEKEDELRSRLRVWTLSNYDSHAIEIGEDHLILRWSPTEAAEIDFRTEAREIARKYLSLCAELGRADNYASCQIYDRSSGAFLGSNGIYIPSL